MKRLELARRRGRELREVIGAHPEDLQARLEQYLLTEHKIRPRALSADAMQHGKAELLPQKGQLRYDKALDNDPAEKLFVFAHELGHLKLHQRLIGPHAIPNPLRDSRFTTSDGAGAIARYNPKDAEEVEANAFAKEFVCPADLVFADWMQGSDKIVTGLTEKWGVSVEIIQVQLAEALFDLFLKGDATEAIDKSGDISLNKQQQRAAEYLQGATIVDAGPGTGKTATLVMRVDFLLREEKVDPSHILILTFSNEAADELRERIGKRFDEEIANSIEIHTFHSFGHARLLSHAMKLASDFSILDEIAQEELLTTLLGQVECEAIVTLRDPGETARHAVEQINFLKDRMYGPVDLEQAVAAMPVAEPREKLVHQKAQQFLALFRKYEDVKHESAVDFADLILLTLNTLRKSPTFIAELRKQYQHVLVDEFQDVSLAMVELLGQICGEGNQPWVVGDIRQAIYRFRGADPARNVALFKQLFPAAQSFDLRSNYRSCPQVVRAANQMATLMAAPEQSSSDFQTFWEAGSDHQPFGEIPVQILAANSDAAEQEGIAELIRQWLDEGIKPGEIAVLARRNIDVRNIVLALGKRKIKAMISGLVTPEGAAGDLAAVLTLPDARVASIPRVVYALGRGNYAPELLNEVIRFLVTAAETEGEVDNTEQDEADRLAGADLIVEYKRLFASLHGQKHSSDAFAILCLFLFDGGVYLRRLLSGEDKTLKALALSEIITSLTRAAGYRFTHQKLRPRESRLGFAQCFRDSLSSNKPVTAAPRSGSDAVRVLTCHASKGLEFPCVVVAGQTLNKNKTKERNWWLPPTLMPASEEDRKQADSLLFVGLTRAQRAVTITYAEARTSKGDKRELPGLLGRWQSVYSIPQNPLPEQEVVKTSVSTNDLWGRQPRAHLSIRYLDKSFCGVATYLEQFLRGRFPEALPAYYPRFTVAVRRAMRRIIISAQLEKRRITEAEAEEHFFAEFHEQKPEWQNHPHKALYERIGLAFSKRFATAFRPHAGAVEFLHASEADDLVFNYEEGLLPLRLDLVACFRDAQGAQHMLIYRHDSLSEFAVDELNWSDIKATYKRVSFVVLRQFQQTNQFWAFSGADARLYRIKPNRDPKKMDAEATKAIESLRALTGGKFVALVDDYKCGGCPVRVSCPHWLGAIVPQ
ncbi:MAG: UvrD-helicase domain-containing protein [Acidobacteriota bacterium]